MHLNVEQYLILQTQYATYMLRLHLWPSSGRIYQDVTSVAETCRRHTNLYLYDETNVTHFLFRLLRIKGLYMFRALLAHPQEALNNQHLVYCVRVMSVGCTRIGVFHSYTSEAI
jgi:hypothetical protein